MSIFQSGLFYTGFDDNPAPSSLFDFPGAGASIVSSTARFGGFSLQNPNHSGKNLQANLASIIDSAAFITATLPASGWRPIREWSDLSGGGVVQVSLQYNSSGALQFFQGSGTTTPLGPISAAGVIRIAQWAYLEAGLAFNSSTGTVQCRVWGPGGTGSTPVITGTALNTAPSGNNFITTVFFESVTNTFFDDWYMLDLTGAAPLNTFLGNVWSKGDAPTANSAVGGRNAWAPTTPQGVNWKNVANVPLNAAQFNSDATVGDYDMFAFPALPSGVSTVYAVQEVAEVELDSAGPRTVLLNCDSGGTDSPGTAFTPPSGSYTRAYQIYVVNPNTGLGWGVTAAGSAELGLKVAS